MASFIRQPVFQSIGHTLLGDNVDLYFTSTMAKVEGKNAGVDWHQDIIYDLGRDEAKLLCWTSITASYPENGGLYVFPGSHRNGILPHRPSVHYERDFEAIGFSFEDALPLRLEIGDMLVLHPLLVHGSPENRANKERIALMAGLQRPKEYGEAESRLRVEILRDGKPVADG